MKISERAVRQTEKRALAKLRAMPAFRKIAREYFGRDIGENLNADATVLNDSDVAALLGLAKNALERKLLIRVLHLVGAGGS